MIRHYVFAVIGADILDKTNTNAFTFGRLKEEQTWWQLEEAQRVYFDEVPSTFYPLILSSTVAVQVQRLNQYLREEYHQLQVYGHRVKMETIPRYYVTNLDWSKKRPFQKFVPV